MLYLFQSDIEFEQFYLTSSTERQQMNYTRTFLPNPAVSDYPASIDWRTKGAVSAVKDQASVHANHACNYLVNPHAHMLCTGSVWS